MLRVEYPAARDSTDPPERNMDNTVDERDMSGESGTKQGNGNTQMASRATDLPSGDEPFDLGSGRATACLGAGGMAQVYKIWNEKLEVYRAVKVLLPSTKHDLTQRFETEAKITAKLHHPNIVDIYNVGEWNGLPYIEMELVDGDTLETIVHRHGRLPTTVCSAIGVQIARSLCYAHDQDYLIYGKNYHGVIHRDLKPANIMLSRTGQIKLMDFGIARPTEAGLLTVDGNIVGTLQYLSPEQLDGKDIDGRTDIYSLGAVLYEMMTGTKTFPQNTITNLMKTKVVNSYRKFDSFEFPTNHSLAGIVEKCLASRKTDRYDNAGALLDVLDNAHGQITNLSPQQVLADYIREPSRRPEEQQSKPRRLIPRALVLCVALLLALVAGLTVLLLRSRPLGHGATVEGEEISSPRQTDRAGKDRAAPGPLATEKPKETREPKEPTPATTARQLSRTRAPDMKTSRGATRPETGPTPKRSPMTPLQRKYGSSDLTTIGEAACRKGNFGDAITALRQVPKDHPRHHRATLFLLQAYMESRRYADAQSLVQNSPSDDAFMYLLRGRLSAALSRTDEALNLYQNALTKPSSVMQRTLIRAEALYHTALAHDKRYSQSPSKETRLQAINAWNNVKRSYANSPEHARRSMAEEKLGALH